MRRKRPFLSLFGLIIILVLGPLAYFRFIKPRLTSAAWFDDKFYFRTAITITNSGSADTNKKVKFDIDTATLYSAGKIKINCDDSRFTDTNGKLLQYYLDSGSGACNTNSTDYYVLVPTINAGTTTIYHYYGNPSAIKGSQLSQFSQATFTQSATTTNTEEQSKGPVAYWSFDEGYGTIAYDATSNKNNGTLGTGTSAPTWQTEDMCVSGKCLYFGGNDFVSIGNTAKDVKTISFWVKPTTTSQNFIDLDGGTHYISDSSGAVSATGFGTPTIYVNGRSNGTLTANNWNHIEVTTATSFNATSIKLGRRTTTFLTGFIDEAKIYPYVRSAAEVKADYNAGKAHASSIKGSSASLGNNNKNSEAFSEGLVGYWKMEENTGTTVADSSGNSNTATLGTGNSAPGWAGGMYGIGLSFDGSNDYVSAPYNSSLKLGNNGTISLWYKPSALDSGSHPLVIYGNSSNYNNGYLLNQTGSSLYVYWKNFSATYTPGNVFTVGTWTHIVVTNNNGVISIYKNSQNITPATASVAPGGAITDNYATSIGGVTPGWSNISGIIDEVRIYNRALSPAEVQQLYNWAPGPVAYYNFNEGVGSSAFDTSGYGNNGGWSGTGTHWTAGKYGKAANFNGITNYITVPHSTLLNFQPSGEFTIDFWYKYYTTGNNDVFGKWDWDGRKGYAMYFGSPTLNFYVGHGDGTQDQLNMTPTGTNVWQHIAYTVTGKVIYAYLNGVAKTSVTFTKDIIYPTNPLYFDYQFWSGVNRAVIDEVRIYNYARTQKQIVEDMNAGHPAGGSPVGSQVAYYKFDEGYGTTANNSGNGGATLNGTISGASWNNDGKFGKTLNFDGTDDVVTVTNATAIDLNGGLASGFSFSGWFNADSVGEGSSAQMFWKGNGTYLRVSGQSGANLNINASVDLTTDATKSLTAPITTNAWNHIVMAWTDDNDDELTIWVNGKNMGSSVNGDGAPAAESNNLLIGGTTTANFDGKIDDFKVYSYELTEDEIKIDYNRGSALQLGTKSSGAGNTAPSTASSQEYCIPGDTTSCSPPVGRWDFNEGVGSSAFDTSGNGNNGGLGIGNSAPTWATGKIGKGLKFDGVNQKVSVADTTGSSLDLTTGMTLEAWIYRTSTAANQARIVNKDDRYALYLKTSNKLSLYITNISPADELISNATIPLNVWTHVAATYTSGSRKLYINGTFDNSDAPTGSFSTDNSEVTIGNFRNAGSSYNFRGSIDQVRIFNYARSPAQIAWDYNKGAPVGHWKFDECQANTAHNSQPSTTNLDGTITIGPLGTQAVLGTCAIGTGSTAAWGNGATGKYNASLKFDGTDDYVSIGTGFTAQSVSLWVKPASNTSSLMQLSASANITASSGLISATGFSTPTIYVNGIASTTLSADVWQMVTVTTATGIPAGAIKFGLVGSTYYSGQMDEVKIWNYALTSTQVKLLYNQGAVRFGD